MISLDIQRRKIVLPKRLQGLITGASLQRKWRQQLNDQLEPQR